MDELEHYQVDSTDDLAPTARAKYGPDGGLVPGGVAGYTYDGAAYCPECAAEIDVGIDQPNGPPEFVKMDHYPADAWDSAGFGVGVISGMDEWDAPGASCDVCFRRLQTNVIRYDE